MLTSCRLFIAIAFVAPILAPAQMPGPTQAEQSTSGTGQPIRPAPLPFAIQLKATQSISSADAVCGQIVLFATASSFAFNGLEFPAGTLASGRVTQCKRPGRAGRGGLLEIQIEGLQLPTGQTFPLSGVIDFHGGSRDAGVAGGALAAGLIVAPYAAPAALLLRGKAAIMPAGAVVVATMALAPERTVLATPGPTPANGRAIPH